MIEYRCYFLNTGGHIIAAEDIITATDDEAILSARASFAQNERYAAFELWQGNRRLHHEARGG